MANIVFTDWNNYTDRDGNAQTLDWDNLPDFLEIGVGLTALKDAINEKIEIVNEVSGLYPNQLSISSLSLSPFNVVFNANEIDSKIQEIDQWFFDLDNYPTLNSWTWENLKLLFNGAR